MKRPDRQLSQILDNQTQHTIASAKSRPFDRALEHGELMSQREVLDDQGGPSRKQGPDAVPQGHHLQALPSEAEPAYSSRAGRSREFQTLAEEDEVFRRHTVRKHGP